MSSIVAYGTDFWQPQKGILEELFNGRATIEVTAQKLASSALGPLDQDPHEGGRYERTWNCMLAALIENSSRLRLIANLFICISRLPPALDSSGKQLYVEGARAWQDMPCLGWSLNSEWNGLDLPKEKGSPREAAIGRYVSINKLIAILMSETELDYRIFALWTMRAALEYPEPQDLDLGMPGAASLVDLVGEKMYQWDEEFKYGGNAGDPGRGGPLWDGKGIHGFCKERWALWHARLCELGGDLHLSDDLRDMARQASIKMAEIEKSNA